MPHSNPTTPNRAAAGAEPRPRTLRVLLAGRALQLEAERLHVVGSGPKADVRIVHRSVAPAHALLSVHVDRVTVETVGSDDGVWIGPVRVQGSCDLTPGQTVRIGDIELQVQPPAGLPPKPVSSPRHAAHQGFAELMAEELRRAPWFGTSLLLHVLVLLILFWFWEAPPAGTGSETTIRVAPSDTESFADQATEDEREIVVEEPAEAPLDEAPFVEEDVWQEEVEETAFQPLGATPYDPFGHASAHLTEIAREAGKDILDPGGAAGRRLSGAFRSTIAGIRETGLEIVFVFDSTGSMGPVITATRRRMTRMVEALHALVPDSRIGVVTYRDHGRFEEYVTRAVPLSGDYYRALLFVHTVTAGGGGDRAEAVFDGVGAAVGQDWRPGSRRAIVLIGDAPAHSQTEQRLAETAREFAASAPAAAVHAIMTSSDFYGQVQDDTEDSFAGIAHAGDGLCLRFENEERIVEQVLTLAIGAEHRGSVGEVFKILDERVHQRGDGPAPSRDEMARELGRTTVDPDFVARLIQSGDRRVADDLITMLAGERLAGPGRHAAAWALQRLLGLSQVIVDPTAPSRPLNDAAVEVLRRYAARLAPATDAASRSR